MQAELPVPVIEIQLVINASPRAVWHVLTAPEGIAQWLGVRVTSNWTVGAPVGFAFTWNGKAYEDKGTILRFDPPNGYSYSYWSELSGLPDVPANYSVVSFALEPTSGGVRLDMRHDQLPSREMFEHTRENWVRTLATIKSLAEAAEPIR